MAAATPADFRDAAFFEAADGPPPRVSGGGTAGPLAVTGDSRRVAVHGDAPSLLVVTEQYSRFWTAEVDGAPVAIVPVDGAFMGVPIGTGDHVVTMAYRPPYAIPAWP